MGRKSTQNQNFAEHRVCIGVVVRMLDFPGVMVSPASGVEANEQVWEVKRGAKTRRAFPTLPPQVVLKHWWVAGQVDPALLRCHLQSSRQRCYGTRPRMSSRLAL